MWESGSWVRVFVFGMVCFWDTPGVMGWDAWMGAWVLYRGWDGASRAEQRSGSIRCGYVGMGWDIPRDSELSRKVSCTLGCLGMSNYWFSVVFVRLRFFIFVLLHSF